MWNFLYLVQYFNVSDDKILVFQIIIDPSQNYNFLSVQKAVAVRLNKYLMKNNI